MQKSEVEEKLNEIRAAGKKVFSDCVKACRTSNNLIDIKKNLKVAAFEMDALEEELWNFLAEIDEDEIQDNLFFNVVSDELGNIETEISDRLERVREEIWVACNLDPKIEAVWKEIFGE